MFLDFFKKIIKMIKTMITDDKIAAAQLAQIFGSELLRVQQSVSDSQSQPDIVRLNPKSFLVGESNVRAQQRQQDQRLLTALQQEAESIHPLPQEHHSAPIPVQLPVSSPQQTLQAQVRPISDNPSYLDSLSRIASSLERIANKFDSFEVKSKRKSVKRKQKSVKPIILNENNL